MEKHNANGQVYVETTTQAQSMVTSWLNNCTGREENPKSYRNTGPGVASLYAMALRTCTWNIHDRGMPEALPHYDWELVERIYQRLKETDTLTFKAWSVFKTAFPGKIEGNYQVLVPQKAGGLGKIDSIRKQVTSLSFDSLTFLCIRNLQINDVNLNTDLLKFKNLAVLVLEQLGGKKCGGEDDRMIKSWGMSVATTNYFQKLTVLSLKHFDISVLEALKGLTAFPVLVLCNLDSRHVKKDLEPFLRDGKVYTHPNGWWRQKLTDGRQRDPAADNDPEIVWSRSDITTHRKMELLYDMSAKYLTALSMNVSRDPIISIHYGHTKSTIYTSRSSVWFMRTFPSKRLDQSAPVKREADLESGNKDPTSKKRKLRAGKGQDIGSLLESFSG